MTLRGYIRVSDDEQDESLQRDALTGAGCEALYCDHGVSGDKTTRKDLDRLLNDLKHGDTLMVWKFDRLGRSTVHLLLLFDDFRKRGIRFVSLTQSLDTESFEGRIFFGQLALFAEYEREMIRQRTRAGMQAAKKRGIHIGRPRKLDNEEQQALKLLAGASPVHEHQHIANRYRISLKTLNRILTTDHDRKPAHDRR